MDASPRDHDQGHDVEMTGDELRGWQLESKHKVYSVFHAQLYYDYRQVYCSLDVSCNVVQI